MHRQVPSSFGRVLRLRKLSAQRLTKMPTNLVNRSPRHSTLPCNAPTSWPIAKSRAVPSPFHICLLAPLLPEGRYPSLLPEDRHPLRPNLRQAKSVLPNQNPRRHLPSKAFSVGLEKDLLLTAQYPSRCLPWPLLSASAPAFAPKEAIAATAINASLPIQRLSTKFHERDKVL
jgi:hypothetical protein